MNQCLDRDEKSGAEDLYTIVRVAGHNYLRSIKVIAYNILLIFRDEFKSDDLQQSLIHDCFQSTDYVMAMTDIFKVKRSGPAAYVRKCQET